LWNARKEIVKKILDLRFTITLVKRSPVVSFCLLSVYENKFQIYCTFRLLIYPALPDRPIISQLNLVYQNINILFALLAQHVFTFKGTDLRLAIYDHFSETVVSFCLFNLHFTNWLIHVVTTIRTNSCWLIEDPDENTVYENSSDCRTFSV
jgi:hypothetical protein